jgi:RHS repeat-associated protein
MNNRYICFFATLTYLCFASAQLAAQTSRTSSYLYNNLGQVISLDGPRSDLADITSLSYHATGELSRITNALGQQNQYSQYDGNGNLLSATDANGVLTQFSYDSRNRLTSVTSAIGTSLQSKLQLKYDNVGNLIEIVDPLDRSTNFEFDDGNRLIKISDNLGNRIEFTLDVAGNPLNESVYDYTGVLHKTFSQSFDELSRQLSLVGANYQTELYAYDANGNRTTRTDGNLNQSSTIYDGLNRETESIDPYLNSAFVSYNELDQISSVTDERGLTTLYSYDGFGYLHSLSSPDTGLSQFSYDDAGNLTSKTDANGVVTNYQYDALNRLTEVSFSGAADLGMQYQYDSGPNGVGRLTGFTDNSGQTSYSYDELGRITEENYQTQGNSYSKSYSYNLLGEVTSIRYPSGALVSYTRDALGKISQVDITDTPAGTSNTLVSEATYLPFGSIETMTYGNDMSFRRTYDQDYRLTGQEVTGGLQYQENAYQYDGNSNITQISDLDRIAATQDFSYDNLDRLTLEESDYGSKTYQYDAVGNRTKRTFNKPNGSTGNQNPKYAVDSNQLTFLGRKPLTYDANGNLTDFSDRTGSSKETWAYDQRNRLVGYWKANELRATYNYNALGQRVLKVRYGLDETEMLEEGNTFVFHYDQAGQLIQESRINMNGVLKRERQYIWLDDMPIAYLETIYRNNGNVKAEHLSYITVDHLNTPRFATNANQEIVWNWRSDAFGIGSPDNDPDGDGINTNIRLRFPGQYEDSESGLHYNYYRDYEPSAGRYVQSDPIGLNEELNTYLYSFANPATNIDIFGLKGVRHGARGEVGDFPRGMSDYLNDLFNNPNPYKSGSCEYARRQLARHAAEKLLDLAVTNPHVRNYVIDQIGSNSKYVAGRVTMNFLVATTIGRLGKSGVGRAGLTGSAGIVGTYAASVSGLTMKIESILPICDCNT